MAWHLTHGFWDIWVFSVLRLTSKTILVASKINDKGFLTRLKFLKISFFSQFFKFFWRNFAIFLSKWKNGGFLRVCGCFCAKKGVFCKKSCYRFLVNCMNLARCAKYWSISNAIAFCVVLNIGVNIWLSFQVFCHSRKLYFTKDIISFGAAWA